MGVAELQSAYGHHNRPCCRDDILRAARSLNFTAKKLRVEAIGIRPESLPAIVRATDGEFFVLARVLGLSRGRRSYLIQRPDKLLPERLSENELQRRCTDEVVFLKPRRFRPGSGSGARGRQWRIPLLARYRRLLSTFAVLFMMAQDGGEARADTLALSARDVLTNIEIQLTWREALATWLEENGGHRHHAPATFADPDKDRLASRRRR